MINLFEASTVKATHHIALASAAAAAFAFGAVSPLVAQAQRTISRNPESGAILVVTFRTAPNTDKKLGAEAGEALRDRIPKDTPGGLRGLWVIPTADIKANLEPAGFKYEDALSTNDAKLLAASFRADEFVEGRVESVGGDVRVRARMVMTNDAKDRHVLAAAVRGWAELIVTENVRDFPATATARHDIDVVDQDEFLLDQWELDPVAVRRALTRQVSRYRREPRVVEDLLIALGRPVNGCPRFAAACYGEQAGPPPG